MSKDRNTKDILINKNHSTNANIIKITKKYTNMRKYNECLVNIKYCFNVFLKVWTHKKLWMNMFTKFLGEV